MILSGIQVQNYRSIIDQTISINEIAGSKTEILLGKNESGKTNFLKAISLINEETPFNYSIDCNKSAKKEKEEVEIALIYSNEYFNSKQKQFPNWGIPSKITSLVEIHTVKFKYIFDENNVRSKVLHIWIKPNSEFNNYAFNNSDKTISPVSELYVGKEKITKENVAAELGSNFTLLRNVDIETILESAFEEEVFDNLPNCVFWSWQEKYLLNGAVNLETFKADPNSSIPLRNIFHIAGISNIEDRINLIASDLEERTQLKQELSFHITKYINKAWPEHKINLYVEIEGTQCYVMVEEQDDSIPKYNMDQRSDGFKQFIAILLNLIIETERDTSGKQIIILDEPEIHLHPSGVKYLREQLIRMGKENILFVATHSIYMVDKLSLARHFKVQKEKAITTINQIEKNNPYEEEVIYEALGTSMYEHIQPNMILFEGKTDKDLFDAFSYKFRQEIKPLGVGTISADGVEKMPQIAKFMNNNFVNGYVMVDSDSDGVRIKNQLIKDNQSFTAKNAFEINDIKNLKKASTLEDLIPFEYIRSLIQRLHGVDLDFDNSPIVNQLNAHNKNLKGKLNIKELKGKIAQEIINDISKMSKKVAKENFKLYHSFVEQLHKKVKNNR